MSRKRRVGLLACAFAGLVALALEGCGGDSGNGNNGGAAADAAPDVTPGKHKDSGSLVVDAGGGQPEAAAPMFDGTSGKPCSSNADCGSMGINICSNFYSGKLSASNGVGSPQFWPTPLCMVPLPTMAGVGNCDPGDPGTQQFCDSADPLDPASPGICLPLTNPQQAGAGNGFCLPHCSFALDGSPAVGCPGKDTCTAATFLYDAKTKVVSGHGYCQGTCQADSDCSDLGTGWGCQTDLGVCTKTKKVRTKTIGTVCSNSGMGAMPLATSDTETGACNCPFSGTTATAFYCTSACVIGGTPCPTGYVCDAFVPGAPLTFTGGAADGGDLVLPAPTKQNPGVAGQCFATCGPTDGGAPPGTSDAATATDGAAVDSGAGDAAAGDAGSGGGSAGSGVCPGASNIPPISTCTVSSDPTGTVAGPDCLP